MSLSDSDDFSTLSQQQSIVVVFVSVHIQWDDTDKGTQ